MSLRSVSRICIININAAKNLKQEDRHPAKHMIDYGDFDSDWKSVIILDETKFNIYDPDGCHYYWN